MLSISVSPSSQLVKVCEPILTLLRHCDGNYAMVGKVHLRAFNIKAKLDPNSGFQGIPLPMAVKRAVSDIWRKRWDFLDSPMHGAGYCLDPENLDDAGITADNLGDRCIIDLNTILERMLQVTDEDGCCDEEATAEAVASAMLEYASFRAREGAFGLSTAAAVADRLPAHQWWEVYGVTAPHLKRVAVRILAQPASACACERNWSTYDFIHNKRRNRLTPGRARDLVYVFTNGRLADKILSGSAEEEFCGWVDCGEGAEESDSDQ
jgi:hypothetical protein